MILNKIYVCRLNGKNWTKITFPCSMRATRLRCCVVVTFWEAPRNFDAIRHSVEERPIKYTFIFYSLKMVSLASFFRHIVICRYVMKYLQAC